MTENQLKGFNLIDSYYTKNRIDEKEEIHIIYDLVHDIQKLRNFLEVVEFALNEGIPEAEQKIHAKIINEELKKGKLK